MAGKIGPHMGGSGIKIGVIFENYVTAGTIVKGHVTMVSDRDLIVTAVKVHFMGKALTLGAFKDLDPSSYAYANNIGGTEIFIDKTMYLTEEGERQHLSKGDHSFPFSLRFPIDAPQSYEEDDANGCIRYTANVCIERQGGTDLEYCKTFEVTHPLHLFRVGHAEDPIDVNREKAIKGCCLESGTVDIHITSKKTGYIPGEKMKFEVSLDNNCSLTISKLQCTFHRRIICKGKSKSGKEHEKKFNDKQVCEIMTTQLDCKPGKSDSSGPRTFTIPDVPPSYYEGCDIIDVLYYIQAKLHFKKSLMTVRVQHEIIVGTTATPEHLEVENTHERKRKMSFQTLVRTMMWE